ncbi:MAG: YebC/PmpR family DNA-binding transcriptional regulator [Oscillospiraceae bacterium]
MAGHSKWNNIKRKKEKTDSQKAKIFTKIGREISVAIKDGGCDPAINFKLRDLISKAKQNNVPNENIDRAIKKASKDDNKNNYESVIYEGYGPNGTAFLVETLTDNRNRTSADLKYYFDKYGASLGTTGCVSYMFNQKGVIIIDKCELNEEILIEKCLNVNILDIKIEENYYQIETDKKNLNEVYNYIINQNISVYSSEISYIPDIYIYLNNDDHIKKITTLIYLLEDNEDVISIWHNSEF